MPSRRIGIAWELGFGSSYLNFIRALGQTIIDAGHQCVVISRDPQLAQHFLGDLAIELHHSPVGPIIADDARPTQTSYASLLYHNGFHDSDVISRRLNAWIRLLRETHVELLLARHSPTALLAARCLGLPAVHYGNSFSVPPPTHPWPSFRPDLGVSPDTLFINEARVRERINTALRNMQHAPLQSLQQLYAELPTILLDYPELDPWCSLRSTTADQTSYLGFPALSFGAAPVWPARHPRKVFLSLLPHSSPGWAMQLTSCGAEVLLRVRDAASQAPESDASEFITRADTASLNFSETIAQADLVVGYGSHNLVCESLLAGKPVAVIMHSADELVLGQRLAALGMGCTLPSVPDKATQTQLQRFLYDDTPNRNARSFAQRYAEHRRTDIPAQFLALAGQLTGLI